MEEGGLGAGARPAPTLRTQPCLGNLRGCEDEGRAGRTNVVILLPGCGENMKQRRSSLDQLRVGTSNLENLFVYEDLGTFRQTWPVTE